MKKTIFVFILLFIIIAFILSEVIIMKNEKVINGKIINMNDDTITVITKTEEMVINKYDVKNIYYNEADYLKSIKTKEKETKENNIIVYEERNFKADE